MLKRVVVRILTVAVVRTLPGVVVLFVRKLTGVVVLCGIKVVATDANPRDDDASGQLIGDLKREDEVDVEELRVCRVGHLRGCVFLFRWRCVLPDRALCLPT